jgi:thiol-disulfide isomerase/thioredoxin
VSRRGGLLGLAAILLSGCAATSAPSAPTSPLAATPATVLAPVAEQGPVAADFELETITGERVRLAELLAGDGQLVLLDFWSTWCEPCKLELPHLDRLQQELGPRGLRVLAVAVDGPATLADVRSFVRRRGLRLQVPLDPERRVIDAFNPKMILPYWVLIDRQRQVIRTHQGYLPGEEAQLAAELDRLLPQPAASPPGP